MRAFATAIASAVLVAGCSANASTTPPEQDDGWRRLENHAIMNSIEHVVVSSYMSPAGAARLYAYSLTAAAEARRRGGEGAAIAAADSVLEAMLPLGRSLQQTALPGLASRVETGRPETWQTGEEEAVRWLEIADSDGAAEQTGAFGTDSFLKDVSTTVDIPALRERIGIPVDGLNRVDNAMEQLHRLDALPRALADDELFSWEPTATGYTSPEVPGWGQVLPIRLPDGALEQCRIDGPDREQVLQEGFNLLYQYDIVDAASWQATVWLGGRGTVTPPGMWIRMAHDAAEEAGTDGLQLAADVAAAVHNSIIIGWDEKFRHNLVRPETLWQRLFAQPESTMRDTPAHPSYPSGHSVISAAAAHVIEQRLGDVPLTLIVPGTLGWEQQPIEFANSQEALKSVSGSRVMARFHYELDTVAGHHIGVCAADLTLKSTQEQQR